VAIIESAMAKAADEASAEIAKGLSSIVAIPSAEVGNYIADKIRFLRFKSLLKVLKKAEKMCEQEGTKLKAPAIKFLVPFAEAASLEEEDDDNIQSLWANLLKNSDKIEIADGLMFVNFLKNIGHREVKFLKEIVEGGRARTNAMFISFHNAIDAEFLEKESYKVLLERLPDDFDYNFLADLVVDLSECTGVIFLEICLLGDDENGDVVEYCNDVNWEARKERMKAITVLQSLGIVEKFDFKYISVPRLSESAELFVKGYRLTSAGVSFYEACNGSGFKHKFDQDINDDQTAGIRRGLEKRIADKTKPDGDDITNLYQNNGYLFSNINAVETESISRKVARKPESG